MAHLQGIQDDLGAKSEGGSLHEGRRDGSPNRLPLVRSEAKAGLFVEPGKHMERVPNDQVRLCGSERVLQR